MGDLVEADEPVGVDDAVREAFAALERAMTAAAERGGHELAVFALVFAIHHDGKTFGGSLVKGDATDETMEFLADILLDGEDEDFVTEGFDAAGGGRPN